MKLRPLKLIFLLNILCLSYAFSQNSLHNGANILVKHYNNWLKANSLDKLIQADSFYTNGAKRLTEDTLLKNKAAHLLILTPAANYQEPEKFALAWNTVRNKFKKTNTGIYALLLNKLADYSLSPPDSVAIMLKTADPDIFSLTIYYDQQIKIDENVTLSRNANQSGSFNCDAALGNMKEICFETSKQDKMDMIRRRLEMFFKKYRHGSNAIKIDSVILHNGKRLQLTISNVYGQVTGKNYHEVIYLDLSLDDDEICYTVDASYAAGILSTPDPESDFYREVELDFPERWLNYRDNLDTALKSVLYGR